MYNGRSAARIADELSRGGRSGGRGSTAAFRTQQQRKLLGVAFALGLALARGRTLGLARGLELGLQEAVVCRGRRQVSCSGKLWKDTGKVTGNDTGKDGK